MFVAAIMFVDDCMQMIYGATMPYLEEISIPNALVKELFDVSRNGQGTVQRDGCCLVGRYVDR